QCGSDLLLLQQRMQPIGTGGVVQVGLQRAANVLVVDHHRPKSAKGREVRIGDNGGRRSPKVGQVENVDQKLFVLATVQHPTVESHLIEAVELLKRRLVVGDPVDFVVELATLPRERKVKTLLCIISHTRNA